VPYKSDAQRKYFNANREKLEAEGVDVDHWNEESKGKTMPEKKAYAADTSFADDYDDTQLREALAERVRMIAQLRAHRDSLLDAQSGYMPEKKAYAALTLRLAMRARRIAQLRAHRASLLDAQSGYMPEKRAYGYSDDYGYIERVPWLNSQNRTEVLERMAKAQKLAKKQKLDVTYATSRWGEEDLSPEDAYKMVEALPDSAFTGDSGYGGTDDTIPWSVSSSTRDGNKYNFRKDPFGIYDHIYENNDDHEYDGYGNYTIPYEEHEEHELDENGNWFRDPIEAKNWEGLRPKKSWLGSLFGKKAYDVIHWNAEFKGKTMPEKKAYGYEDDYVIHDRHLSATPNASLAEQLEQTEELKEQARLLEGNLKFTDSRYAELPEDYYDYDEAINRIKNKAQALPLFYQISRDDGKPLNSEAAMPPEYLDEYLLDKQGKAMSNIQMLAKKASLRNALSGSIGGAVLGGGANFAGSLAGQFLAPLGGEFNDKVGPDSFSAKVPMTLEGRRKLQAKALEDAYEDFKFNYGDAAFNERTAPYMGIGAAAGAASGALTDDEEEKRSYALSDIQLLAKEAAGRCWEGYEPVSGKKPYSDGSCQPVGGKKKKTEKKADGTSTMLNNFLGQKSSPMQQMIDSGVGAGIGGLGGALYGAMAPGEDEDGEQKSRLSSGLYGGILGGIGGAGLGGAASQFREGGLGSSLRDQYFPKADTTPSPDEKYKGTTREEGDEIHKEVVDDIVKKYPPTQP
jgi:hypothetical protein